jgi:hypothetical protein
MDAVHFSENVVYNHSTRNQILQYCILLCQCRENSYLAVIVHLMYYGDNQHKS